MDALAIAQLGIGFGQLQLLALGLLPTPEDTPPRRRYGKWRDMVVPNTDRLRRQRDEDALFMMGVL